jgi:hypothetical protein
MEKTHKELGDSSCSVDDEGNVSNSWLHNEMLKGFDDQDFRLETRQHLIDLGMRSTVWRASAIWLF